MKVLLFCPLMPSADGRPRIHRLTMESILSLEWDEPLSIHLEREDYPPQRQAYHNIQQKYTKARHLALDGGYDALLTVEADMVVPPDALRRLAEVEADVAYGLYCSRHPQLPVWLAFDWIRGMRGASLSMLPEQAKAGWGKPVETAGVGLGCTLIHRHVLEAVPFRWTLLVPVANDWLFALDLQEKNFTQKHHLGVVCGHIYDQSIIWPDIDAESFFRVESLGEHDNG